MLYFILNRKEDYMTDEFEKKKNMRIHKTVGSRGVQDINCALRFLFLFFAVFIERSFPYFL